MQIRQRRSGWDPCRRGPVRRRRRDNSRPAALLRCANEKSLHRPRPDERTRAGPHRPRLRGADADPEPGDSAAARGARPARPGRHRYRQDRRVCAAAAAAGAGRAPQDRAPGRAGAGADARTRDAGRRSTAQLRREAGRGRAADLRRRGVRTAGTGAEARRACGGGHAGPRARSHPPRHAEPERAGRRRAGRSRRDARHGFRRGHRSDPRCRAGGAADGALLGHAAAAHRGDRRQAPARSGARADRAREDRERDVCRACARPPTSCSVRTRWPRSAACWISSRRRWRWCSAARAPRSTSWPRSCAAAATRSRRCTAG